MSDILLSALFAKQLHQIDGGSRFTEKFVGENYCHYGSNCVWETDADFGDYSTFEDCQQFMGEVTSFGRYNIVGFHRDDTAKNVELKTDGDEPKVVADMSAKREDLYCKKNVVVKGRAIIDAQSRVGPFTTIEKKCIARRQTTFDRNCKAMGDKSEFGVFVLFAANATIGPKSTGKNQVHFGDNVTIHDGGKLRHMCSIGANADLGNDFDAGNNCFVGENADGGSNNSFGSFVIIKSGGDFNDGFSMKNNFKLCSNFTCGDGWILGNIGIIEPNGTFGSNGSTGHSVISGANADYANHVHFGIDFKMGPNSDWGKGCTREKSKYGNRKYKLIPIKSKQDENEDENNVGGSGQSVAIGDNSSRVSTFGVISTQGTNNSSTNEMKTDSSHAALKVNEKDKEQTREPSTAQVLIEEKEKEKEQEKETKKDEDKDDDEVTTNMDIEIESDDEDEEEEEDDDVDDQDKIRKQRIAKLGKLMKQKQLPQDKAKAKDKGKGKKGNEKAGKKEGKNKNRQFIKTLEFDRFESSYQLKSRNHGGIKLDLIKMNNNSRFIFVNSVSFGDDDDSLEQEERFGEAITPGDVISSVDYGERKNVTDYNEVVNILQSVLANKNQHLSCNIHYFHLRIVQNGARFHVESPKLNKNLKDKCVKYFPKFGVLQNCLNDDRVNEMLNDVESEDESIDDVEKRKELIYAYAAFSAFHIPKFKEDNYQFNQQLREQDKLLNKEREKEKLGTTAGYGPSRGSRMKKQFKRSSPYEM